MQIGLLIFIFPDDIIEIEVEERCSRCGRKERRGVYMAKRKMVYNNLVKNSISAYSSVPASPDCPTTSGSHWSGHGIVMQYVSKIYTIQVILRFCSPKGYVIVDNTHFLKLSNA